MRYSSPLDAYNDTGSTKPYYSQFPTAVPELGKIYRQTGCIYHCDYKIIFIDDNVALGVTVATGNSLDKPGKYCLFSNKGFTRGWKYEDNRPVYRLQEIIE